MLPTVSNDRLGLFTELQYGGGGGELPCRCWCLVLHISSGVLGSATCAQDKPSLLEHLSYIRGLIDACKLT